MKHIICFTESLGGGGAEHQMVLLAGMLAEKRYNVSIVTYASLPDHYDTPKGVERIDIGYTKVRWKWLQAIIKAFKVFHFFIWTKADCIISYRECANLRLLPPLFFRSRRIKVICSDRNLSVKLTFTHRLLLNILYDRADFVIPNSNAEMSFILRNKPQLESKLRTIHNYTDLKQFSPSSIPADTTIIKIAIFSRYSSQKNPLGFAEAMCQLKQKSSHRYEVHWYGTQTGVNKGYNNEYLCLKSKIDNLDISDVLKLYPSVKNPAPLMEKYHAVCLPSLFEGFSNSIAEGICSGKPMLVSNVSDNPIMVHEGENGFLFNPQDGESICSAFIRFFEKTQGEMCQMAEASRRIAEQLFDKDAFIQKYIDLIES